MTFRSAHLLPLVALVMLMASGSAFAQTDYDSDNDGLIDITNLAQLNAIRGDLNGDGAVDSSATIADTTAYNNAFSGRDTTTSGRMGCPSGTCTGYELLNNLDFDTDGSGTANSGDTYWNDGAGWLPIAFPNNYTATFDGKGHTISNLFINRTNTFNAALFGRARGATIRNVGLENVDVTQTGSGYYTAALIGAATGGTDVVNCYSTGRVSGNRTVGGLVGLSFAKIITSYSTAAVTGNADVGGLAGSSETIIASYAIGPVTGGRTVGGLVGRTSLGTITASYATGRVSGVADTSGLVGRVYRVTFNHSYYDRETTGQNDTGKGTPKFTFDLQNPTGYTGIYENWNVDTDDVSGVDNPWDFGTAQRYPVLRVDFNGDGSATWQEFGVQRIVADTPTFTKAVDPQSYQQDKAIEPLALPAALEGNGVLTYSLTNLPAGLTFDAETLTVSGTPTEAAKKAIYTLTATDEDGDQATLSFFLTVIANLTFTKAVDPQSYQQDKAIEPLTLPAAIGGNGILTYSLTNLPAGLTFDAETLTVSGTPTESAEKAIYTLTVTDEDGDSAEVSFFLTVIANLTPSFGDASVPAQAYMRKQELESMTLPQATGGDEPLTYALTPDLPEGLTFDVETLTVSGTPLEAIAKTTYTLTATDSDGDEATLMFTLEVMADPMPSFTTLTAYIYVQHREISSMTLPQATGGDEPLTYALTPDLPAGLTFDVETFTVSGTPIKAMDETTYTLTATDGNGDEVSFMFTLEVPDLMPTFGDSTTIAAQSYLVNQEIESLTFPEASSGDGMLVYILLPFLPDGLSFDPNTRTLSGMPTEEKTLATYTLSALDTDGDVASLPFTLEVTLPSPDFDSDGTVNFADFLIFASKFGSRLGQERYDARCDLNGDSQIDFDDFLDFAAAFGG